MSEKGSSRMGNVKKISHLYLSLLEKRNELEGSQTVSNRKGTEIKLKSNNREEYEKGKTYTDLR